MALISVKEAQIKINNEVVGLVQNLTVNMAQNVERVTEIGSKYFYPIAGFKAFTFSMRRLLVSTGNLLGLFNNSTESFEFDLANLESPVTITVTLKDSFGFQIVNAYITSHSMAITAGTVVIYEDVAGEAEKVAPLS